MNAEAQRRAVWCELVSEVAGSLGEVRLRVAGASMLPVIWPGDLVTVQRCEFTAIRPGQIVLRQIVLHGQEQNLTLHRVARIAGDHLVTRGDSLSDYDPPVKAGELLGQVVSISRNGRTVSPEQAFWQRIIASVLRQSRFSRRVLVYLHRRWQRMSNSPPRLAQ